MQASPALARVRRARAPRQRAFNQCPSSQQRAVTRTRGALRAAMPKRRAEADEDGGEDAGAVEAPAAPPGGEQSTGKKGKFRKEKPWDVDGTDHWCASRCQALSMPRVAHVLLALASQENRAVSQGGQPRGHA